MGTYRAGPVLHGPCCVVLCIGETGQERAWAVRRPHNHRTSVSRGLLQRIGARRQNRAQRVRTPREDVRAYPTYQATLIVNGRRRDAVVLAHEALPGRAEVLLGLDLLLDAPRPVRRERKPTG